MNKFIIFLFIIYGMCFDLSAQESNVSEETALTKEEEESAASQEAGAYERKSVSYIDALWLMDRSVRDMPQDYVGVVLEQIKKNIMMERFDYNPLSEALIRDFVDQANSLDFSRLESQKSESGTDISSLVGIKPAAGADPMLDSITAIMERTLVPKILEIVNAEKEMRAQGLLTEQQQNSFISDKAKEIGITAVELKKVMNSAFIFIPLARRYGAVRNLKDSTFVMRMEVGIIWWRISVAGDKASAIPVVKKFSASLGRSRVGRLYPTSDGVLDYHEFAFRALVKNAARNIKVATQAIDDFRLSSQILERSAFWVSFNLGEKEGLRPDDKYRIIKKIEEADGSISEERGGWIRVTRVGKTDEGNKSKGSIVSGKPIIGSELSEYPRLPIDILFKFKSFAFKNTDKNTGTYFQNLDLDGSYGFQVNAAYNFGRFMNIPQLFFDFGFGMGFGKAKGTVYNCDTLYGKNLKNVTNMTFDFSLVKKFYLRRFVINIQPVIGIQNISFGAPNYTETVNTINTEYEVQWFNSTVGFAINGGLEFALSPWCNIGVVGGYQLYGENSDWEYEHREIGEYKWKDMSDKLSTSRTDVEVDHSGETFQVYITISPPSLPFDPIDWIRGMLGI